MSRIHAVLFIALCLVLCACDSSQENQDTVTIYCALDQVHSEALLKKFEKDTGIRVRVKFDTETSKTISLVNAIIAESSNPRCDVFWNNEISQTIVLQNRQLLAPYKSPSGTDIPTQFKDPSGHWHGFAARSRVFIVNNQKLPSAETHPQTLEDYLKPEFRGQMGIAKPLFGTTATHVAALFSVWGAEKAKNYLNQLKSNQVIICAGNAHLKDRVSRGEFAFGLTDTDDFNLAKIAKAPVTAVFPGQKSDGCLVIPNTVAMIKNAPHPQAAKKLIDYILSHEVEKTLAMGRSAQIPLRPAIPRPDWIPTNLKARKVDWNDVAKQVPAARQFIQEQFLKD